MFSLRFGRDTPIHSVDQQLITRRLLTKTNRLPRWAERFFPSTLSRCAFILEDSIVDPVNKSFTTYTWNLNHTKLMSVKERCIFQESVAHPSWTQLQREAWISSDVFGFSRAIQEFGLARFKSNQVKAMRGLEYALTNLYGDVHQRPPRPAMRETKEAQKHLTPATAPQKPRQYV
ncbi:PRELI domain containing 1b isoform X2 [Electrophorus electricus]|uniref:PRELI domain containing 1b isoform X2 n=1 Tax=Electrophorus electricus TaxID=8005 RepID=UPI000F0A2B11|nr:PRELI domain containing 1b isoform X2 [Electrophorus electricus]